MNQTALIVFASVLVGLDLITALFLYYMFKRILVIEVSMLTVSDSACRATCQAISALSTISARHTEEIVRIHSISNSNQVEILSAVHAISDRIPSNLMPRDKLDAIIVDLYRRTEARDPDANPPLDADIP